MLGTLATDVKKVPAEHAPAQPKPLPPMGQCSDSARRPLAERIVIWNGRLRRATTAEELLARYEGARTTCEVPDWRAQSALLGLIQGKVRTEGGAETLLARFAGEIPWAHLDIAGTAWNLGRAYAEKGGSGWGVRLLVSLADAVAADAPDGEGAGT